MKKPGWLRSVFAPLLLLCLNLFVFGTMTVYFGNEKEFLVEDEDVLLFLLGPAGVVLLAGSLLTALAARRWLLATSTVMFVLAFATYLHGNVLRWDAGILDGEALHTGAWWAVAADFLLWAVLAALAWRYRQWLAVHGLKLCVLLAVFQLVGAVDLKHRSEGGSRILQELPAGLPQFHDGPNVVHIVLDGFQGSVFGHLVEQQPGLGEDFSGFTYFRDTLTPSDVTYLSLPASLSGRPFDNQTTIAEYHDANIDSGNLYHFLHGKGLEIDVATPVWWNDRQDIFSAYYWLPAPFVGLHETIRATAWYLLDISLFRQVPSAFKPAIYSDGTWLLSSRFSEAPEQRFEHFAHNAFLQRLTETAELGRQRSTYKLIHLITPHAPLVSRADCGFTGRELPMTLEATAGQSLCTTDRVLDFLQKLRELGIYDEALIVIHGDHGGGVPFPMVDEAGETISSLELLPRQGGNPLPLLMVKPPGAGGPLAVSDRFVSLADIPATVSGRLGLEHSFPGVDVFSAEPARGPRVYYTSEQHRNDAFEKGRFSDFTRFSLDGSMFEAASWRKKERFEAWGADLSGVYAWGTELTFGRNGSYRPFSDGGWTVTRTEGINWTQGKESGLLIPLPETGRAVRMQFSAKPMLVDGLLEVQRVRIEVNGREIGRMELDEYRTATHVFDIPADLVGDSGSLAIRFYLPDAAAPAVLGSGADERELALAFSGMRFDPVD